MLEFLFFSCVLGIALWWVTTSLKGGGDDPVGRLLCAVPRVFTQPHLLATPPGVQPTPERSSDDDAPSDGTPRARPGSQASSSSPAVSSATVSATGSTASPAAKGAAIEPPSTGEKRRPLFDAPAERDDLKRISGIGPVMERHLNALGVVSFAQLASFDDDDIARVDAALTDFRGRIVRDDWVGQARAFIA